MNGDSHKVNRSPGTIEVRDLSFAYAREQVLKSVTFTLEPGAIGLLGPNGSGKTTLLRALMGHLKLPRQTVFVLGSDMAVTPRAARRDLGWMPEIGGIIPGMSGVAMVSYLGTLSGMPGRDAMQRAHEVLDYVGLGEARYRKCEDYSQGMRQRLKLAQSLVHDPSWLLLDEPTSGLDPKGRMSMLRLVRDLAEHKQFGIIFSTHLLPDVEDVCREVLILRKGELLAKQPVAQGITHEHLIYEVEGFGDRDAFFAQLRSDDCQVEEGQRISQVTAPGADGVNLILQAAASTGFGLRRLQRQTKSLEDVFHDLVKE